VKVSVSITTYNHEPYIAQAVEGVLAQETDFDFEVVVGDDCSTDGTRAVILDLARRHPGRIRPIFPEKNFGDGGKRIFLETIKACQGRYIATMDGDDYWTSPNKLQLQVELLDSHPECSMCFHDVLKVYDDGSRPSERYNGPTPKRLWTLDDAFERCFAAACSPLFRREVLDGLPPWYLELPFGDWPLLVLAARQGPIVYLDEVMGVYRIHAGGMWSRLTSIARLEGILAFYRQLEAGLGPAYRARLRRGAARYERDLAFLYEAEGDVGKARSAALRALRSPRAEPVRSSWTHLARLALKPWTRRARNLGRLGRRKAG
jgi:glycosyltransferase involved in cell wall biosynthesis